MSASSVPPTPSFSPAPPPVLARTSSMLVLSRRSSQRMAALRSASWPVHAIPAARGRASREGRARGIGASAWPIAVAGDVAALQRVIECLGKGVGVDEGLGRRIALAPAGEDVLLLHQRE